MAELDPPDPMESAYRDALLSDEQGRDARRARLMAALPQGPVGPVVRQGGVAAWRRQPQAWALAALVLMLAAAWVLMGRVGSPQQAPAEPDPRVAAAPAAPAASAPTVIAQADPAPTPPPAAAAEARPASASTAPVRGRARQPASTVAAEAVQADTARAEMQAAAQGPVHSADAASALPAPPAAPPAASTLAAAPALDAVQPGASPAPSLEARQGLLSRLAPSARGGPPPASGPGATAVLGDPAGRGSLANVRLQAAALQGDVGAARAALQAGASVQSRDVLGRTPLMLAARGGGRELVALLLAAGARPADRDRQGWTALDHARDRGHDGLEDLLQ